MINTTISKNNSLDLLNEYQAGSTFFFASPFRTMLAEGINTIVHQDQIEKIPELIVEVLNNVKQMGHPNPIIVGAFPFDCNKGVKLIVPQECKIAERLQP
ncbi:isochorismate synthase, partial [Bacillus pseudomycoides]